MHKSRLEVNAQCPCRCMRPGVADPSRPRAGGAWNEGGQCLPSQLPSALCPLHSAFRSIAWCMLTGGGDCLDSFDFASAVAVRAGSQVLSRFRHRAVVRALGSLVCILVFRMFCWRFGIEFCAMGSLVQYRGWRSWVEFLRHLRKQEDAVRLMRRCVSRWPVRARQAEAQHTVGRAVARGSCVCVWNTFGCDGAMVRCCDVGLAGSMS